MNAIQLQVDQLSQQQHYTYLEERIGQEPIELENPQQLGGPTLARLTRAGRLGRGRSQEISDSD